MSLLKAAKEIFPGVYCGAQLCRKDVALLAKAGITTIICNRPDYEDEEQTCFAEIQLEATKQGIKAISIPFTASNLHPEHIEEMKKALEISKKPIFAYCRSGGRVVKICSMFTL